MKRIIRLTESDLHNIVKESVSKILKETRFGRLEPFFGHKINGKSGMLYSMEGGKRYVLYHLRFDGDSIIGVDRETNKPIRIFLTSLFARPIDGSTIPSVREIDKDVIEITHLRLQNDNKMYNLTIDDYFGSPEETAERDYASGY